MLIHALIIFAGLCSDANNLYRKNPQFDWLVLTPEINTIKFTSRQRHLYMTALTFSNWRSTNHARGILCLAIANDKCRVPCFGVDAKFMKIPRHRLYY